MEKSISKSLKTTATIILIASILVIFANLSGAIMSWLIDLDIPYFTIICSITAGIGFLYLIGSYFMIKKRVWSRIYLLSLSRILIISAFLFLIIAFFTLSGEDYNFIIKIASIVALILFGLPSFFLIKYLTKDKVKSHFA